ncbi:MAG: DUF1269 domain-containing protein [Dehalococcoidia bacterium]|nr:DUF1269 domain-containing protein [Dehalococcoidia bacterium]
MYIRLTRKKHTSDRPGVTLTAGAVTAARAVDGTQIHKYAYEARPYEARHGFAAEDANHRNDILRGRPATIVGTDNKPNGPDRKVNGVLIQSKYCRTAWKSVDSAFDKCTGMYRYAGQVLEVPKDQFDDAVQYMARRIAEGKVPGYSDPADAVKVVKQGSVTYQQAKNIARAGNLDSLIFDAKTQVVSCLSVAGISFVITFARSRWSGRSNREAAWDATKSAGLGMGATMVTGVVTAQLLRTPLPSTIAETLTRLPVQRQIARGPIASVFRSTPLATAISFGITSAPDFYRATLGHTISKQQLAKNTSINAVGTAGGSAGWVGGMYVGGIIGTAIPVPVVGTAAGALMGGIIGSLSIGMGTSALAHKAASRVIADDAQKLIAIIETELGILAEEYLVSEDELAEIVNTIGGRANTTWLRRLYRETRRASDDAAERDLIRAELEPEFEAVGKRRQRITPPGEQEISVIALTSDPRDSAPDMALA